MEKSAITTSKYLVDEEHDVEFISLHKPKENVLNYLKNHNIKVSYFGYGFFKGLNSIPKTIDRINKFKPNCIFVVGHSFSNILSCLFVKHNCVELNIHFHHKGTRPKIFWYFFYKITTFTVKSITFPSSFTLDEAVRIAPFIKNKSFVNYNPVDLYPQKNKLLSQEKFVIGGAGWLIKRKRFDLFIDLAILLLQKSSKYEFLIAGDGPELSSLKSRVDLYGISNHFSWLGAISDMQIFYSNVDICVFFTDADAAGLIPLESIASNVPVVASCKYCGFYDLFKNSKAMYIQNNHNLADMVKEINLLESNDIIFQKRVKAGREFIMNNFSRERHLLDLFNRIKYKI